MPPTLAGSRCACNAHAWECGWAAAAPHWCRRHRPAAADKHRLQHHQRQHHQRTEKARCASVTSSSQLACSSAAAAGQEVLGGAATMEEAYDLLAQRVMERLQRRGADDGRTYIVGVAGVPGSGKSSLAKAVCARLNAAGIPAANVGMDGFHYARRQLDQMPDPQLAHSRRGAEWTFDARAYVACLASIKQTGKASAPSFDHGVGDPVAGHIAVRRHHRVVISEGNYLLLSAEPWWQLRELLDEAWFVHCDVEEAMQRVYQRQTGHGVAPEVSRWRVEANDRPNAEQVAGTARHASLVVPTLPLQAACTTS